MYVYRGIKGLRSVIISRLIACKILVNLQGLVDLASVASNARFVNPRGENFWESGHKNSTRSSCLIRVDATRFSCYNRTEKRN